MRENHVRNIVFKRKIKNISTSDDLWLKEIDKFNNVGINVEK
jgi:hypothetical protein